MIQVRDIFQVKFGQIDQAVALFSRFRELSPAYKAGRLQLWFVQLTGLAKMGAHEFFRVEE